MFGRFFNGRYGIDNLGIVLVLLSSVLSGFQYTWFVSIAVFGYALFRAFSKDKFKRSMELEKFNRVIYKFKPYFDPIRIAFMKAFNFLRSGFKTERMKWNQRKQYVFFKCSKCGRTLRLPRGKGKLQVTCPNCKTQTFKKT